MGDLPGDAYERLAERLEALERRIDALEHSSGAACAPAAAEPVPSQPAPVGEGLFSALTGGAFPVLGKAMLGIAGAYVLRAVAESSALPKPAVAAVAIAYAILWLIWAAQAPAGAWFASTTYACTSALILAPMLWELTLRFKVISVPMTAIVLGGFVIAASALAWKRDLASVFWVANLTVAALALGLSAASHQIVPFLAVLLLMVLLAEYAGERGHELSVRPLVALAADAAIWGLIFIYSGPSNAHLSYPALGRGALLAPSLALFLIFAGSVSFKTVLQRKTITVFETVQTMIAFLLGASSVLYFGPRGSTIALGVFCMILSAVGYAAVFLVFDRLAERRNYRIFATWSAALFLGGGLLCLPPLWLTMVLILAAIEVTALGARLNRLALEFHGAAYLLAAAILSGLLGYCFHALADGLSGAPGWSVYLATAGAILCYAAAKPVPEERRRPQALHIVSALLAVGAAAALLVKGLMALVALRVIPAPHHLAFIRTFTICAAALALAFSGARWRRKELTRISYAALVLLAVKLVFEDLRVRHLEFSAASIFLFAITLIAVPRFARMGRRE